MSGRNLVLCTVPVPREYIRQLESSFGKEFEFVCTKSKTEALQYSSRAEVITSMVASKEVYALAGKCKWVHSLSAGVESFLAIGWIKQGDVLLTNSAGVYAIPIAEHVMAMILAFTRRIDRVVINQKNKNWIKPDFEKGFLEILELSGRTVLIVGLGKTGMEIATRAKAFGMKILAVNYTGSFLKDLSQREKDSIAALRTIDDLNTMLPKADIIVNCLPLTSKTLGLFDQSRFSLFKEGAIFVNVGRGGTVSEKALISCLKSGRIKYAALDVFEEEPLPLNSELWKLENVIVSSHYSGISEALYRRIFELFTENFRRFASGEPLLNLVDKKKEY